MRILQVTAAYYPELQFGGPPQKIHALSVALVRRGHEVRALTFHSGQPSAHQTMVYDGITVQYVPWLGWQARPVPGSLTAVQAGVQWAQLVHCYGLYNLLCPAAAWIAHCITRPYVLEPLGMYRPRARHQRWKRWYHRLFTGWMARGAARVIATSTAERDELDGLTTPDRLVVRANRFDFAAYRHLPDGNAFRDRIQLSADEQLVLFIGRISPIKNLEALVQAFAQLKGIKARLALVGPQLEPDYTARLKEQIAVQDLSERVTLTGPMYDQEKLAALAAADVFVLPSLAESFGNAAAEAVAAGVPVLLTETCGIAPLIHQRAGQAVPPTVDGLAAGLRALLLDEAVRRQMMQQRDAVLAELSSEEPVQQMEQIYRDIIQAG